MGDKRTNQTLDALGDLYLTGAGPLPAVSHTEPTLTEQLDGPRPFRISTQHHGSSIFDRDDADHVSSRAIQNSCIQGVFLGNLPGFGGPWLTQYAHVLSQSVGPVVVLHIDHEQIDLELVGAAQHRKQIDQLASAGDVPANEGLMAALSALTRPMLPRVGAYLVHLPMPLNETSLTIAPDLPKWTMISATDQASVVAAFRWISELTGHPDDDDQPTLGLMVMGADDQESHAVVSKLNDAASGLVHKPIELVGSLRQMVPVQMKTLGSFEAGPGLWPRLAAFLDAQPQPQVDQTFEDQPELSLRLTRHPIDEPKVEPAPPVSPAPPTEPQIESPIESPVEPEIELIELEVQLPVQAPVQVPVEPDQPQPVMVESAPPPQSQPEDQPQPQSVELPEPVVAAKTPSSVLAFLERINAEKIAQSSILIEDNAPAPPPVSRPAPEVLQPADISPLQEVSPDIIQKPVAAESPPVTREDELDLAQFIHAMPLLARCPHQEQVHLAIEPAGRLHMLLQHQDPAAAMTILSQVRSWASQHAKLLQLTSPQHPIDFAADAILHVFTADAKAAAAMVSHVDSHIRLHLLQTVVVAGQSSWFTTELN